MRVRYSFSSRRTGRIAKIRKQRQKFPALAQKIVDTSDIILEVLDARFIDDTRNIELEKEILKQNKKIIFVLNKSDLINEKKIKKKDLQDLYPYAFVSCSKRTGIKNLRNLIKRFAKQLVKDKTQESESFEKVQVGVIGYPNTGKSSLINILIGKSKAGVGSDAGFTKGLQKLRLSSDVMLIDSPGVIPREEYSSVNQEAIAKQTKVGARSFSQVKHPEDVVAQLVKEYRHTIDKFYKIKSSGDAEILIEKLGKKRGFLKKGGEVNEDKVARYILKDWQSGEIKI